jgi:DNA polymerase-3 subunit beta
MEIKLTVPAKYIAVLKLFAAEKDMRSYLNGICLEIGRTESRLVAIKGHMLGCFRVASDQPDIDNPLTSICIASDLLKHIKPAGDVEFVIGAPVSDTDGRREVRITYAGLSIVGHTTDSKYPDWRRVIPDKVSGEAAQFNPEYIGRLAKAWACLHGKRSPMVAIAHNGDSAALIGMDDSNFCGLIMPIGKHFVTVPAYAPDWATGAGPRAVENVAI